MDTCLACVRRNLFTIVFVFLFYIMALTDEQRKIIEESMWVINTVLKAHNLAHDEDMRQQAILYMCECIERFDPSKNAKFSTYAYKNIYLYVLRKKKALPKCEDEREEPSFDFDFLTIKEFEKTLSTIEAKLLYYKCLGFRRKEIMAEMTLSPKRYTSLLKSIRKKAECFYAPP